MVYDCFQFFNELDILKLRMNILNGVVDYFVIAESTVTFSGESKPLYYAENQQMFQKFKEKVIHVVIDDTPEDNAFARDVFQKNAVKRGLENCKDEDIIIYSDVDEIPNPEKIHEIIKDFDHSKIYHMAQRMFYCYLNYEEITGNLLSYTGEFAGVKKRKWLGTKVCSYRLAKNLELGDLRAPISKENGIRIENGGWHWGYMGGTVQSSLEKRVGYKVRSAAHQEFNDMEFVQKVMQRIQKGQDIFGRDADFRPVLLNQSFPEYLIKNREYYRPWILEESNRKNKIIRNAAHLGRSVKRKMKRGIYVCRQMMKKAIKVGR